MCIECFLYVHHIKIMWKLQMFPLRQSAQCRFPAINLQTHITHSIFPLVLGSFICFSSVTSRGPEHSRTGGWSLLAVMSDWQRGVDWLLAEYCRCRLWLDLHWCRWRVGAKGLCLAGPLWNGETNRPESRDPVASGVKRGPHCGKKSKTKSSTRASAG
jgi:hypothetical protein